LTRPDRILDNMRLKSQNLFGSFYHAGRGVKDAVKQEPNLKIHIIFALLAVVGAFILHFSYIEFAIIVLTIAMVFVLELINTTLETVVDIVSPEIQEKARIAKDVSAAGVLLAAIASIIIVALLFLPKII
jgi:diacylglycerol kinase